MEIGTVKQVDIQQEMQGAYLDYAMSVIVARALPDVRDGLKPVHRRILYAMHDMGLQHDKPYRKSARIVGEVLGKYHPHGDVAVYDAMVRMAQDFSLRYTLVDGQGNFGSVDGDNPAAMRYTEARLQELAHEMLADISKDTVDFASNFDDTLQEPMVLPGALPNLLVNGASGIAVGMATNIPPHNLAEVCDALTFLIDRFDRVDDVSVEELMQFVKGPDFPTGGIIYRYDGNGDTKGEDVIARAYASGRGRFRVQARAHIEEMSRNRNRIVVTELPYQVNKTRLIERIAEMARDEKIEGITDLRDESDRTGMRIVIELTRNVNPKDVLSALYKYTPMQQTFGMTMLALVDGEPRLLSLRRVLQLYVEHRRVIIRRRSEYDLARARERAHILEGLLKALDILDDVIQTIRRSQTTDTARSNLMRNFKFTQVQAQAILDMPLKRLAALERKRLQDEYKDLLKRIAYLEDLLANPHKILGVIKQDLTVLRERYGDARRTRIVETGASRSSLTVRDLIEDEPVLISLGRQGLLLREPMTGRRKGKLPSKIGNGSPSKITAGSTHDELFIFSADGRMARVPVHRIPNASEVHPEDLGVFKRNDRLVGIESFSRSAADSDRYLVLATRDGRVKRVTLADAWAALGVTVAMKVEDGDELIGVQVSQGDAEIMLVTKLGQAIRFREVDVRPMGLPAAGVWGMKLNSGDEVVSLGVTRPDAEFVVVTTEGYFKRTPLKDFSVQRRHGAGLTAIRLGQRSGAVSDACIAAPGDEIFSSSRRGTLRRIDLHEIPRSGRSTLGRMLIQPAKGDVIADLLHLPSRRAASISSTRRGTHGPSSGSEDDIEASQAQSANGRRTRRGSGTSSTGSTRTRSTKAGGAKSKAAPQQRSRRTSTSRRRHSEEATAAGKAQSPPETAGEKPAPASRPTRSTRKPASQQPAAAGKPRPEKQAEKPSQLSLLDRLRSVD